LEDFGLSRCKLSDIATGTPKANAAMVKDVFSGKDKGPRRQAVILNAAMHFGKFMIHPYNKKLFLNVNHNTMHDENFRVYNRDKRRGEIEKFPLITLTIVVISNKEDKYPNSFELTRILAKMKRDAKQEKGILQIE
jgi:hypothetical protein